METPPIADEYLHSPSDRRLWNESYYFDFGAGDTVQGCIRLGFQPYEDRANVWLFIIHDGAVYWYRDEEIPIEDMFGLNMQTPTFEKRYQIQEPHKRWSIAANGVCRRSETTEEIFDGEYSEVDIDGEITFQEPAHEPYSMALHVENQSHYNHAGHYTGELSLAGDRVTFDANGFRDHSWGWFRDWTPGQWGHYWTALQFDSDDYLIFATQVKPEGGQRKAYGYHQGPNEVTLFDSIHVECVDGLTKDERAHEWAHGNIPEEFVYEVEIEGQTEEIHCTPTMNIPIGYEDRNWELTDPDAPWLTSVVNRMPLEATWDSRSGSGWFESSLPL